MVSESKIVDKLETIDQYRFERLVDNLLHQGAFPQVAQKNSFLESFGTNIEKERTIKSAPRADAEIGLLGIKVEKSVEEDWRGKLKKDIRKNQSKIIKKFVFVTNQDTSTKLMRINNTQVDAAQYCNNQLRCQESFIIGRNDLVLTLQNPDFSNVRRNFLAVPDDFFRAPSEFLQGIRETNSLSCDLSEDTLRQYSSPLDQEITFSPREIILLHNDDYVTLLHVLGVWARDRSLNSALLIAKDFCFINWPRKNADLQNIDHRELNNDIETFVIIWGAHEIQNLSEYLKFTNPKTSLIFVTKTSFKDSHVISQLQTFGNPPNIREVSIAAIDKRTVSPEELLLHEAKLKAIIKNTLDSLKRFEALIYFYSPVYLSDVDQMRKIAEILKLNETQLEHLRGMLLQNDLAGVTGNIIWVRQPGVARTLLSDFIKEGVFVVEDLM